MGDQAVNGERIPRQASESGGSCLPLPTGSWSVFQKRLSVRLEALADGFIASAGRMGADFDALGSAAVLVVVVDAAGHVALHAGNGGFVFSVLGHNGCLLWRFLLELI